jgi:hypothetical protein
MPTVQRPPSRTVATRLKRRLQRLARQEYEPSARAARSVLAGDPHEHYPAFVSRPYMRHGSVWLSKPSRIGWHYVLSGDGPAAAAICVGHTNFHGHAPMSVQSATFVDHLRGGIEAVAAARGRSERPYSLAVVHLPELMLLLLWIREGDRSRYWVLEPSHPDAPRGMLIGAGALRRLVTKIYGRFAKEAHAFW